jgi:hypothetical protein
LSAHECEHILRRRTKSRAPAPAHRAGRRARAAGRRDRSSPPRARRSRPRLPSCQPLATLRIVSGRFLGRARVVGSRAPSPFRGSYFTCTIRCRAVLLLGTLRRSSAAAHPCEYRT